MTATDRWEAELLTRVLSALLREDVVGLRTRSTTVHEQDGPWLRLATGEDALLLPVAEDGFQCRYAARRPVLVRESDGAELTSYDSVLGALRELAEPEDRGGFDAFAEECRQTLATLRLHTATRAEVMARLTVGHGLGGSLAYDTLAARHDHPVYPTARGRSGLTEEQLRAYAPEFRPRFALRWLAVPWDEVTVAGKLPEFWPTPDMLGLPDLRDTHVTLPVHPLTVDALPGGSVLADRACLDVVPTLSMRTVATVDDPCVHLKLPLATATLGLRNKRTIKPGTLVDGAVGQRLLEAVIAREPRFRDTVLHADETTYAHAGHELLAVLCRRYPAGLDDCEVVPLAALLAEAPDGRPVIDGLADRFYGGDPLALLDAALTLLFDWQTTLFGYGVALESHQQNVSLVLRSGELRLLFKDNDGPRINTERLAAALPGPWDFDDARILGTDDGPVADVFTTITVHLCAGAYAFGSTRHRRALLRLVRERLTEAVDRLGGDAADVLRARVLQAPELPVKAMVTAGTLLSKERSGAADINKHYTTGPNYLLPQGGSA
ncbi:IucA/IucC family siderophore biosynthesis protein [Streptomyces ferrugineus]|uniref:IucA/IucC family siderophore biosynthesis protein n=1 Tax=Streptomyces ferrugineus TaxID=1413221 RepID=A0A7M2SW97_9ACTN|nr:IucA/IucC family protein [Streptomyces ferrugineus]QOV40636.1 IucA/IucC family siderophore biosynthesis protein [Streptomyces ferrugineus]